MYRYRKKSFSWEVVSDRHPQEEEIYENSPILFACKHKLKPKCDSVKLISRMIKKWKVSINVLSVKKGIGIIVLL